MMLRNETTDKRLALRYAVLAAGPMILVVLLFIGIAAGAVSMTMTEIWQVLTGGGQGENYRIIYYLRLPRVFCAATGRVVHFLGNSNPGEPD